MPPTPIGPGPGGSEPPAGSDADGLLDALAPLVLRDDADPGAALLDHPALESIPGERIEAAVRSALADLSSARGAVAVRLVEELAEPLLFDALADALRDQPDLGVDRLYRAIEVLEGTGRIEARPELFALREELIEALDGDDASLEGLIDQIEEDPDDVWFALQGLAEIEPDVRAEIVGELGGGGSIGPGTAELLRLLSYTHDPSLRRAAIDALEAADRIEADEGGDGQDAPPRNALRDLATYHPDPEVAERARRWIGGRGRAAPELPAIARKPRMVASLVSGLDGLGRGQVAIVADDLERELRVAVAFGCDVTSGIREAVGRIAPLADPEPAESLLAELRAQPGCDTVEGRPDLALGLLSGSLLLCGPDTPPSLRYWLERTVGPGHRPRPFAGLPPVSGDPGADQAPPPFEEMPRRVAEVLDACPSWLDQSTLTFELAEELLLRWDGAAPDPERDAGAYRFLFEHRLRGQLELYRRMLSWMGWLWRAAGEAEMARSALALAEQLSDPQHVVPAHPFTAALSTRSLAAAQEAIRRGFDPRKPSARGHLGGGSSGST